jgi:hypothetical protein
MVNRFAPPGLEGLYDLDRQGVDIRPTLLRVLTDQFLRNRVPSPEEVERYTELASRLFGEVDIATRASVSARLAPHAAAPRSIILELARDVLDVSEPVLLHSPVLTPADCEAIIAEGGACYAEILARRHKPAEPPRTLVTPKALPEAPLAGAPKENAPPAVAAPRDISAPPAATAPPAVREPPVSVAEASSPDPEIDLPAAQAMPEADPAAGEAGPAAEELCELFFSADSAERKLILLNLEFAPWPAEAPPSPLLRADIWRIETAALRHNVPAVTRELERALGISYQQSRRMVEDDLGEPIVVAAKAMGLPADVLQRIVLFMNPRVGQSVDRVYELAALFNELSIAAARRLMAIVRAADRGAPKAQQAKSLLAAAEAARRALPAIATAPMRRPDAPKLQRTVGRG